MDGTVKVYNKEDMTLTSRGKPVLRGWQEANGLWRIPLTDQVGHNKHTAIHMYNNQYHHAIHNVFDLPSIEQSIRYQHACCGFPTKSTWLKAIRKGNFVGWPLLTVENVNKYFPESEETQFGHLSQQRQGLRSTKVKQQDIEEVDKSLTVGKKERDVYCKVYELKETIYSDQTGKFPTRSSRGNSYIMVMIEIDSNSILVEAMKNRTDSEMQRAYNHLLSRLKKKGFTPRKHVLDNEVSEAMKELIRDTCKLELVPPGCHRRNIAEVAIKTFKHHFVSILTGVSESFPLKYWDRLLPQVELTLNLLRQSNATPTISAYAHLNGPFDHNRMPLAPLGCEVLCHEQADKRGTWAPHAVKGWYIGASSEHYRCHRIMTKETGAERISETVFFKHKYITNPAVTLEDKMFKAIRDLARLLLGKANVKDEVTLQNLESLSQRLRPATPESNVLPQERLLPSRRNDNNINKGNGLPRVKMEVITNNREQSSPRVPTSAEPSSSSPTSTTATPPPLRCARELAALDTGIITNDAPPAMSTRSRSNGETMDTINSVIHMVNAVLDADTGEMLEYRKLIRHPKYKEDWSTSCANEFGRLAQGVGGRIDGTNTIFFIPKEKVPRERLRDVTYGKFVCTVRPEKKEPNRTRFTVGGNLINYPGDCGTPTADMLLVKVLLNSVISTKDARFMTGDLKNFYLGTPMKRYEYIRVKLEDIPQEIVDEYKLTTIATKEGWVYIEIRRGMYGLPHGGIIAQEQLEKRLNKADYYQSQIIHGLWKHKWRPIVFTLVVDDFGVKFTGKEHAQHLMDVLKKHYEVTEDWDGERYIGITLQWDYDRRKVHISMPGYKEDALTEFGHKTPSRVQHSPYPHTPPKYGATTQYAMENDKSPLLDKDDKKFIQKVTGKFLFLGRAVDSTLLTALSALASQQAAPTTETMKKVKQFLDYVATHEDAILTYNASDMILAVHSDAGYLNEPNARSRAGGHFFMSSNDKFPQNNGAILSVAQIIKSVMTSAAEAELGALYINAREAVHIRNILKEMGHQQPPTPMQTDNSTADGL